MIMNEAMYMPFMVLVILGTALLSAVVTTALPYMPKWWNALKSRIKRKPNVPTATDMVDVIIIAQLTERIDDLEEQLNNVIEAKYTRDRNRKNNIRRDVREYLKELQK
jgi:flagellar motor component MotA